MFIFTGLLIGFIAAIPLGPINVFVISQTMKRDFFHGFIGGITACVLDAAYCLMAILGMSQIGPGRPLGCLAQSGRRPLPIRHLGPDVSAVPQAPGA
jgi:hypothetical protein